MVVEDLAHNAVVEDGWVDLAVVEKAQAAVKSNEVRIESRKSLAIFNDIATAEICVMSSMR